MLYYKTHIIVCLNDGRFQAIYQSFRDIGIFATVAKAKDALDA